MSEQPRTIPQRKSREALLMEAHESLQHYLMNGREDDLHDALGIELFICADALHQIAHDTQKALKRWEALT